MMVRDFVIFFQKSKFMPVFFWLIFLNEMYRETKTENNKYNSSFFLKLQNFCRILDLFFWYRFWRAAKNHEKKNFVKYWNFDKNEILKFLMKMKYIPSISSLEWHPFTLSSAPGVCLCMWVRGCVYASN